MYSSAWSGICRSMSLLACVTSSNIVTLLLSGSKGEVNIAGSDPETQEYVLHLKESHCGKSEPYSKINQSNILCFVRDMNCLFYVSFFSSVGTASSSLISALLSSSPCSKSVKQQNSQDFFYCSVIQNIFRRGLVTSLTSITTYILVPVSEVCFTASSTSLQPLRLGATEVTLQTHEKKLEKKGIVLIQIL